MHKILYALKSFVTKLHVLHKIALDLKIIALTITSKLLIFILTNIKILTKQFTQKAFRIIINTICRYTEKNTIR